MEYDSNVVYIDFYCGGWGPLIHIKVHTIERLREIRSIFEKLAKGTIELFSFREFDDIQFTGFHNFTLRTTHNNTFSTRIENDLGKSGDINFNWIQTIDGWKSSIYMLESVIEAEKDCFQIFNEMGDDEILIEIEIKHQPTQ